CSGAPAIYGRNRRTYFEDWSSAPRTQQGAAIYRAQGKTMQPARNTEALDQQFKEFIQALKSAVGSAMPHLKDDAKTVDKAIADCKEILDVVMEGNVKEWLA